MKRISFLLLLLLCSLSFVVACEKKGENAFSQDRQYKLKILYPSSVGSFYSEFGNFLTAKYPNIEFEVHEAIHNGLPDMDDYKKTVLELSPDIIVMNSTYLYNGLIEQGDVLEDLEAKIAADRFDLSALAEPVVESLRDNRDGRIYGLAPLFQTEALFYNKDLFDKYGVPHPTAGMSWEQLFETASRFPVTGDGEYGLYIDSANLSAFILKIGHSSGLTYADAEGRITIDTDSWKHIFSYVLNGVKSGYVATMERTSERPSGTDLLNSDLFVKGKAAMTVRFYGLHNTMENAKRFSQQYAPVNWDIATVPGHPGEPLSATVSFPYIFAINKSSSQINAAWEVIKYINGKDLAVIKSKSPAPGLPSQKNIVTEIEGRSTAPFYAVQKPISTTYNFPSGFSIYPIMEKGIRDVLNDSITLDRALENMENEARFSLETMLKQEKKEGP